MNIPRGWGRHDVDGARTPVATPHAGANSRVLADDLLLGRRTGTAVLHGIPIDIAPA